jgi:hypothetical protein
MQELMSGKYPEESPKSYQRVNFGMLDDYRCKQMVVAKKAASPACRTTAGPNGSTVILVA